MDANPYIVLGVDADCDAETPKRQYRERMRSVHPDLNPGDAMASEKTKMLVEAFEILSDPARRAALDRQLEGMKSKKSRPRTSEASTPKPQGSRSSRPPKEASSPGPKTRPTRTSKTKSRASSRSTVIINGQRIDSVDGEDINVMVGNTRVHMSGGRSHVSVGAVKNQSTHGGGEDQKMGSGTMSGVVMGDLHIEANASVQLSGVVMGDVVSGGNAQVNVLGQVMGDVVLGANGHLSISGKVMGDIEAVKGRVTVTGVVMGDIRARGGKVAVTGIHMGKVSGVQP